MVASPFKCKVLGALIAASLLAGCATPPADPPASEPPVKTDAPAAQSASGTAASEPAALAGVDWVAYFVDGVSVLVAPRPTLRFDGNGQVRGSGGCAQFEGKAQVTPKSIALKGLVSTRITCMPPPSGQEDRFYKALEATREWKMEQDELVLQAASGRELVRLARQRR